MADDDNDADELEDEEENDDGDEVETSAEDASAEDSKSEEAEEEEEEELEPDHPDTIAALKDVGARLDVSERGHVWRIFFYERNSDADLAQIHGLPGLKELWLIGSKVTKQASSLFQETFPKVTVYS